MYLFLMDNAKHFPELLDKFKLPLLLSVKITSFSNPHLFFEVFNSLNCNCSGGNEVISIELYYLLCHVLGALHKLSF